MRSNRALNEPFRNVHYILRARVASRPLKVLLLLLVHLLLVVPVLIEVLARAPHVGAVEVLDAGWPIALGVSKRQLVSLLGHVRDHRLFLRRFSSKGCMWLNWILSVPLIILSEMFWMILANIDFWFLSRCVPSSPLSIVLLVLSVPVLPFMLFYFPLYPALNILQVLRKTILVLSGLSCPPRLIRLSFFVWLLSGCFCGGWFVNSSLPRRGVGHHNGSTAATTTSMHAWGSALLGLMPLVVPVYLLH